MDDLPGNPADTMILICPAGAESAPISHGDRAYPAYPEDPGAERTRWLVRVPRHVAVPLLRVGGFELFKAG
jgi:hypothetical protein